MITIDAAEAFRDNAAKRRFEYQVEDKTVFADYSRLDGKLYINHVEAPQALRGTGAAGLLMTFIHGLAKRDGIEIVPVCGYAAAWLKRHGQ